MGNGDRGQKRTREVKDRDDFLQLLKEGSTQVTNQPLAKRPRILEDRFAEVEAGKSYVESHLRDLSGKFTPDTASQVATKLAKQLVALKDARAAAAAAFQKAQQFANQKLVGRPRAAAGDGKCYVQFVNVGAGDCTLITSPQGTRIMIDCGSNSASDVLLDPKRPPEPTKAAETRAALQKIRDTVGNNLFLNGTSKINLLFLTHADADHHRYLLPVLRPLNVTVDYVYYGGAAAFVAYAHGTKSYLDTVAGTALGTMRKVTLREEEAKTAGKVVFTARLDDNNGMPLPLPTSAGPANMLAKEWLSGRAIVVYYENRNGSDFRISLLAGNVKGVWGSKFLKTETEIKTTGEPSGDSTETNRGSLVLLVECYGRKILICGDATAVTEKFLLKYFGNTLQQVDVVRIAHHGSQTSSLQAFVDKLGARVVVVSSSGSKTIGTFDPKQRILALWEGKLSRNSARKHSIYSFAKDARVPSIYPLDTRKELWATGSNNTIQVPINRRRS